MPSKIRKKQSKLYQRWSQIKQRCYNPNHPKFPSYGGRNILMDPVWRESFAAFEAYILNTIGDVPEGKSLGRIDNDKGYFPGNVEWQTDSQQMRNTRVTNPIAHNGEMKSYAQIGEETGVPRKVLRKRMIDGKLDVEAATTRPVGHGHQYITWNGVSMSVLDWSKKLEIPYQTLYSRLFKLKWTPEKAFTTPVNSWSK